MSDAYSEIMDKLTALGLHDEAFSLGMLGFEARRMRKALDDLAADAWEADSEVEIVHVPPRPCRFVPTVVIGGRA